MIETVKPYWDFRQKYRALSEGAQKLVMSGEALLLLRDTTSEAVKKRLATFITLECDRLGVADKTLSFM